MSFSVPPCLRGEVNVEERLGRHVPIAAGLVTALRQAREEGYDCMQVFPGNPKGWHHARLDPDVAAAVREEASRLDVAPIAIHAPYIINMATSDADMAAKSARSLANALDRAGEIGARYVIVHAGSHRGAGEEAGIALVARMVEDVLSGAPDGVELLVENSAGAGHVLAGTPAALGRLLAALPRQIGACVDTAHLWGGGSDVSDREGVERTLDELDRAIGLERLRVQHVNDSAVPLASHRDVHAHLGQGQIGLPGLAAWASHPALRHRLTLLETPLEDDPVREAARCAVARLLQQGDAGEAATRLEALRGSEQTATTTTASVSIEE